MVQSRVTKFEIPEKEVKGLPQEVLRLQGLLMDNGWKMLIERIDNTIDETKEDVMKPCPAGLTSEEELIRYKAQEKKKMKAECYMELKQLPYEIMREYGEDSFEVDKSTEV